MTSHPNSPRVAQRSLAGLALLPLALAAALPRSTAAPATAAPAAASGTAPARPATGGARVVRGVSFSLYTPTPPGETLACTPAESRDLDALSDEFGDAATFRGPNARWRWFHEQNGWPTMLRRTPGVDAQRGSLYLEPASSGWFADYHAPLLYQDVVGDFDVTARVLATSALHADSLPRALWSLVGLMARVPRPVTPDSWAPRGENWLFITTGTAEARGVPVIEVKSTVNSGSNLKLRPARAGWHELRIVRLRETFLLLSRAEGEGWRLRERMMRRDLPYNMQVGLVAYSDGTSAPPEWRDPRAHNTADSTARARVGAPDLGAHVDWVRFRRPPALRDVAPDWLTDHAVSESTILRFLDCVASASVRASVLEVEPAHVLDGEQRDPDRHERVVEPVVPSQHGPAEQPEGEDEHSHRAEDPEAVT
ncbi:MAG: hypothetical protein ACXW05_07605 [Gemmatirosa sp.]